MPRNNWLGTSEPSSVSEQRTSGLTHPRAELSSRAGSAQAGAALPERRLWNGRRVISRKWVEQSLTRHAAFEPRFGVDDEYGWGCCHIHHIMNGNCATFSSCCERRPQGEHPWSMP